MGIRSNQGSASFINTIEKLFFEVNTVDGERRLRLVLERAGSKYPDWYSCGSVDESFTLNDKGTTWTPKDHSFPGRSMAMWFLNPLMDAMDKANRPFDEDDLESFWGVRFRTENRTFKTKVQGKSIEREKPYPLEVVDDKAPERATKANGKDTTPEPGDEVLEAFEELLEAHGGGLELDSITAKNLKGIVDVDYQTRKTLAATMVTPAFLASQTVAEVKDGVVVLK